MRKQVLCSSYSLAGMFVLFGLVACAKSPPQTGTGGMQGSLGSGGKSSSGGSGSGGSSSGSGGSPADAGAQDKAGDQAASDGSPADAGCQASASTATNVLIDDMETTTHGPIQLAGIEAPLLPGYWYNSGASYVDDGGVASDDTSNPPQGAFVFTALPTPTKTLNCEKTSTYAAHQACSLNGLYDTCGIGFEFAQKPDADAGVTGSDPTDAGVAGASGEGGAGGSRAQGASGGRGGSHGAGGAGGVSGSGAGGSGVGGAGGGGPSVPVVTVPFDISRYKALTFWGMTTTPDPMTGSLHVKVQFPDPDTDPRGQVCNGGSADNSACYNSYAAYFEFTTSWQQFTVLLDAGGDGGVAPAGGLSIDPSWGNQRAQWTPTQVYGINWQAQRNIAPDAGPTLMTDIWVDDVYFVE